MIRSFSTPKIPDVLIVEFDRHEDDRGFFEMAYHAEQFDEAGLPSWWKQDNLSLSFQGVLRGMHIQRDNPQGKLVRCVVGSVWDAWVDLRPDSPTFKEWGCLNLNQNVARAVYVPPGFAHGFFCISPQAVVQYKCTELYDKESDGGILWRDQDVGIEWPFESGHSPELSAKDANLPTLAEYLERLE